ncbi:MAG: hypothetical protein PVI23_08655, partial [Maricaulaceae bacterium]
NLPQSHLDGFWEGNARTFYARDNWEIGAYVKNFTNEDTPGGVTGDGGDPLFFIFQTPRYPRRYGVDVNYRF